MRRVLRRVWQRRPQNARWRPRDARGAIREPACGQFFRFDLGVFTVDVSGQSMLPVAAVTALILPGLWLKLLAVAFVVIGLLVAVVRMRTRPERLALGRPRAEQRTASGPAYYRRAADDGA
jgi:hypothetical protein